MNAIELLQELEKQMPTKSSVNSKTKHSLTLKDHEPETLCVGVALPNENGIQQVWISDEDPEQSPKRLVTKIKEVIKEQYPGLSYE